MKSQSINLANPRDATKEIVIKMMIISFFSFLVCRAKLIGVISPFGVSFTASLPLEYSWVTFLGSSLGYIVLGLNTENIIYLLSLVLVMVLKFILYKNKIKATYALLSFITFVSCLCVNISCGIAFAYSYIDMIIRICECIIAGAITYFSCIATNALFEHKGVLTYSRISAISSCIMIMLGVIALMDINLGLFNIGIVASVTILYIMSYKLDVQSSAICAIIIGLTLNLYSIEYINFSSILVISTLISSLFKQFGRILQVGMFISSSIFSIFILGVSIDILYRLIEILLASGLFLSIRKSFLNNLRFSSEKIKIDRNLQENIENRLEFAAHTIDDLQNSLKKVSEYLKNNSKSDILSIYKRTIDNVCLGCPNREICFGDKKEDTAKAFFTLTDILKKGKQIDKNDVNDLGLKYCNKKQKLAESLYDYYRDFIEIQNEKMRLGEIRAISLEQLSGISQMLWEVSEEIGQVHKHDNIASSIVRDIFTDLAVEPDCVYCNINKFDRMEIDIYTLTNVKFYEDELRDKISSALKREFSQPTIYIVENKVKISFYEKENLEVDFGVFQIPRKENIKQSICGDSYEYFKDNKGNAYIILSDGMGSGKRAALDSALTCSIIIKLLKAGLGLDSIIKFVNTSLQSKSTDEVLSTIDIAKIDLYTGFTEFYKAGSAPSFVSVGGIVAEVKTTSLPAGILQDVEFDKSTAVLDYGDIIILLSDGLLEIEESILKKVIRDNEKLPAKKIAQMLCEEVIRSLDGKENDDLTALVVKLEKGL